MPEKNVRFLIIQTAFIGDVVLATALIEKLILFYPDAKIDMLVRQGNQQLLLNNPHLNRVLVWDKKHRKFSNLWKLILKIRKINYQYVFNLQRFFSTGLLSACSGAKHVYGFKKNPLSFAFSKSFAHVVNNGKHEIERNLQFISALTDNSIAKPKLYPSLDDYEKVKPYQQVPYITVSPASVWFTKALPKQKWVELIQNKQQYQVYLLGGAADVDNLNQLKSSIGNHIKVVNLAGELTFLQSAALMKFAEMNYVNDSAPLHFCSAMNAPVTAFFCSTLPEFGFGPLSENSTIVETRQNLSCRPCGLHGKKACPKQHFLCGHSIEIK